MSFLGKCPKQVLFWVKCLKQGIKNRRIFVSTVLGFEGPGRTSPPKDISCTPPEDENRRIKELIKI